MPSSADFWAAYPRPQQLPTPVVGDPNLPIISIVTPSFNQGAYIGDTIRSILSQDYPNLEYWVIDGGSTDQTLDVLRSFEGDSRYHWMSEPDSGQSDAINKGISRSSGEIFGWVNSDDMLLPGALRHVADAWRAAQRPALIYGSARYVDQDGNDLGGCPGFTTQMTFERLCCLGKYYLIQPAVFIPLQLLQATGGVEVSFNYMMDYNIWFRLARQLQMISIDNDLALYRLHDSSKTVSQSVQFIAEMRQLHKRLADQNLISMRTARVRSELFAARIYFPADDVVSGLRSLRLALSLDLTTLPEVATIAVLSLARRLLGNQLWTVLRRIRRRSKGLVVQKNNSSGAL